MTLQDIAADLQRRIGIETNPAKVEVFTVIANLVSALQSTTTDATIAKLQAEVAAKDSLLNNDAATFAAIKTALGNPNLTQGEIVGEITTKWRHI